MICSQQDDMLPLTTQRKTVQKKMKAIILSAGQGKRLLPLTKDTPKAALKIGTKSLLGWQLQEISKTSIEEVVVITGFGADKIEDLVEKVHSMG